MSGIEKMEQGEDGEPLHLSPTARNCAALFGFGLTSAGAVAVFETENQAGTAALLLLGGFLLVLALIGRFPERGAVGSANWEYRPLRRLLKSDNPEVREAVAGEVLASPQTPQNEPLRAQAQQVLRESDMRGPFEKYVRNAFPQFVVRQDARVKVPDPLRPSAYYVVRPDLLLEPPPESEQEWVLPIELSRRAGRGALAQSKRNAEVFGSTVAVLGVLESPPGSGEVFRTTYEGVTILVGRFSSAEDGSGLKRAIDEAVALITSELERRDDDV